MALNTRAGGLRHPRDWAFCSAEVEFIARGFHMEILDYYLHWFANNRIKISLGGLSPVKYREAINAANAAF